MTQFAADHHVHESSQPTPDAEDLAESSAYSRVVEQMSRTRQLGDKMQRRLSPSRLEGGKIRNPLHASGVRSHEGGDAYSGGQAAVHIPSTCTVITPLPASGEAKRRWDEEARRKIEQHKQSSVLLVHSPGGTLHRCTYA